MKNFEKKSSFHEKSTFSWKNILLLQAVVIIYTFSGIMAKFAAKEDFLSIGFVIFYGVEIFFLGIYAIFWQQMIKRFELSVAYANRAMALLWSMVWAVLIFKEKITVKNILGVLLVIVGIMIINTGGEKND